MIKEQVTADGHEDLVNVVEVKHVLIQNFLTILSDETCEHNLFRMCLNQIYLFLTYEALRYFPIPVSSIDLVTPLKETVPNQEYIRSDKLAIIAVMRGGLEPASAVNTIFPQAQLAQVATKGGKNGKPAKIFYERMPRKLHERKCLVISPRIETASTVLAVLKRLKKLRKSMSMSDIVVLNVVISPEGARKLLDAFPTVKIVTASIERGLNKDGEVIPGIGRTGQRMYKTGSQEAFGYE